MTCFGCDNDALPAHGLCYACEELAAKSPTFPNGKAVIHWMVKDEGGNIRSAGISTPNGNKITKGGRYRVACGVALGGRFASGEPPVVNCPRCRKHSLYAKSYYPHPNEDNGGLAPVLPKPEVKPCQV